MEGIHTGFLRKITRKRVRRLGDRTWETNGLEGVQEEVGTQSVITYIGRRQATVAHRLVLHPIFELCAGGKGYEGGERSRDA